MKDEAKPALAHALLYVAHLCTRACGLCSWYCNTPPWLWFITSLAHDTTHHVHTHGGEGREELSQGQPYPGTCETPSGVTWPTQSPLSGLSSSVTSSERPCLLPPAQDSNVTLPLRAGLTSLCLCNKVYFPLVYRSFVSPDSK